jgi:hypothetical protein
MKTEAIEPENDIEKQVTTKKPFMLSLLCIVFFVHSAIMALLFLTGMIFNSWLTEVVNNYSERGSFGNTQILIFSIIGFSLYGVSFIGTWHLWKMKKKGLLILSISVFLILASTYFIGAGSLTNSIIYVFLLLFLTFFYRKLN